MKSRKEFIPPFERKTGAGIEGSAISPGHQAIRRPMTLFRSLTEGLVGVKISERGLLKALLATGLIELLANRVFSRLAMHIPKDFLNQGLSGFLFGSLASLGVIAYFVSYALACALLISLIYEKLKRPERAAGVLSFLLLFVLIAGLLSRLVGPSTPLSIFYDLASIAPLWMLACYGFAKGGPKGHRLAVVCLALSYSCYYYFKTSQAVAGVFGFTITPPWVIEVFAVGELLAVINSLLLFFVYSTSPLSGEKLSVNQKKRLWVLPSLLAGSLLLTRLLDPYMLSLVSTWSLGWTLYLPFPLYAIAIWLFSFTVLENFRKRPCVAYGLGLIFIAGYTISLSYQVLEAILGLSYVTLDQERARQ